ncbi:hypothetical protein GCM10022254_16170 [Actinomadura meridiana]|uniref:Uncharacterized protein n=1 Tax=Actinomadura meridiana TaxID=559626 RepID=A0ABP8BVM2_9ACTN
MSETGAEPMESGTSTRPRPNPWRAPFTGKHKVLRGGRWSDLPDPGWNITAPPALASHADGKLHAVFANDGHLHHATWREPGGWSTPTRITADNQPVRTWRRPAVASHNGLLQLAYCDPTDLMLRWAHLTPDGQWRTSKRKGLPATELDLTVDDGGTLWLLELHNDSTASLNEYLPDADRYEARVVPARHIDTINTSALVSLDDHLLLATPRRGGAIRTLYFNGSGYTPVSELGNEALNTPAGLAMRTHKGRLHLVIPGREGGLCWVQGAFSTAGTGFRAIVWGPPQHVPAATSHPSLSEHDGDLHLAYLQSTQ